MQFFQGDYNPTNKQSQTLQSQIKEKVKIISERVVSERWIECLKM